MGPPVTPRSVFSSDTCLHCTGKVTALVGKLLPRSSASRLMFHLKNVVSVCDDLIDIDAFAEVCSRNHLLGFTIPPTSHADAHQSRA